MFFGFIIWLVLMFLFYNYIKEDGDAFVFIGIFAVVSWFVVVVTMVMLGVDLG